MLTLGTKVKVKRDFDSFDNNCIGTVIKVSFGLDNKPEYTIQTEEGFFCNLGPSEYKIVYDDYIDLGSIKFEK
jgi:hypothetical protein